MSESYLASITPDIRSAYQYREKAAEAALLFGDIVVNMPLSVTPHQIISLFCLLLCGEMNLTRVDFLVLWTETANYYLVTRPERALKDLLNKFDWRS